MVNKFFESQLAGWPLANKNFSALNDVKVKEVALPGWTVKVQFNPARAASSGAKVDAASIRARKCFLCGENRPAEQVALPWMDGKYEILVNPFPIFPRHFTIPDSGHVLQLIDGRIGDMMNLALLMKGYTVFYNGPRCGASAPDHMHFQAGNSDFLTYPAALDKAILERVATDGTAVLSLCTSLPMGSFVIDVPANDIACGERLFNKLYNALPVPEGEQEPMMNILCTASAEGNAVRVIVIPRRRHRPSFYGNGENGTMMLSPASVDLGGVFITPLLKDFEALDADIIMATLAELCPSADDLRKTADSIKG